MHASLPLPAGLRRPRESLSPRTRGLRVRRRAPSASPPSGLGHVPPPRQQAQAKASRRPFWCRARRLTAGARAAQGSECFAFFLQSGLGKGVLKDVWAAVAGDEGRLSQPQFVACLYLMELARRGIPPPTHAPLAGPSFPPIAGGSRPGSGGATLGDTQQARPQPCGVRGFSKTACLGWRGVRACAASPIHANNCRPAQAFLLAAARAQQHGAARALRHAARVPRSSEPFIPARSLRLGPRGSERALVTQGGHDVFTHEMPLPALPPRAAHAAPPPPPRGQRAPPPDDAAGLAAEQRARLRAERGGAAGLDESLWQVSTSQLPGHLFAGAWTGRLCHQTRTLHIVFTLLSEGVVSLTPQSHCWAPETACQCCTEHCVPCCVSCAAWHACACAGAHPGMPSSAAGAGGRRPRPIRRRRSSGRRSTAQRCRS